MGHTRDGMAWHGMAEKNLLTVRGAPVGKGAQHRAWGPEEPTVW